MVLEDRLSTPKEDLEVLQSAVNEALAPTTLPVPDLWALHTLLGLVDSAVQDTHDQRALPWGHQVLDPNPQPVSNVRSHQTRRVESRLPQDLLTCNKSIDRTSSENRCPAKPTRGLSHHGGSENDSLLCTPRQGRCIFPSNLANDGTYSQQLYLFMTKRMAPMR